MTAGQPQASSGFGGRFLVFYVLLGAVLAAAVTGLVLVALQPGHRQPPPWSSLAAGEREQPRR